jgi:hypothetical protein
VCCHGPTQIRAFPGYSYFDDEKGHASNLSSFWGADNAGERPYSSRPVVVTAEVNKPSTALGNANQDVLVPIERRRKSVDEI